MERLRNFLIGIKFVVYTDCQALVYLNAQKTKNPQIARWYSSLSEYDSEFKHRPGERIAHVNALSRAPVESGSDTIGDIYENKAVLQILSKDDYVLLIPQSDPELKQLIHILRKREDERM